MLLIWTCDSATRHAHKVSTGSFMLKFFAYSCITWRSSAVQGAVSRMRGVACSSRRQRAAAAGIIAAGPGGVIWGLCSRIAAAGAAVTALAGMQTTVSA